MATSKPTVSTSWASDAGASKTAPGVGVQQWGMPERGGVAHDILNGQLDNIDKWLKYHRANGSIFGSIKEMVASEDLSSSDRAIVRADYTANPFAVGWSKAAADLGGDNALAVATDGWRVFVGTEGDVYVLDILDGEPAHEGVGTPYTLVGSDIIRLATDGRYLYILPDGGSTFYVRDPTLAYPDSAVATVNDGGGSAIVDMCVDGGRVYLVRGNGYVKAYEDILGTPTLAWSDTTTIGATGALTQIATNGGRVAVAHDVQLGVNLTVFDTGSGAVVHSHELDPANDPDGVAVCYLRDHLLAAVDTGLLYSLPGWGSSLGGTFPAQIVRGGATNSANKLEVAPVRIVACGPYVAQAYNDSTDGYVALFRWSGMGDLLLPVWVGKFTQGTPGVDTIKDIALGPGHLVVCTKPLATSSAQVSVYQLPPRELRLLKAPTTHRYRAPFYGAVIEEE